MAKLDMDQELLQRATRKSLLGIARSPAAWIFIISLASAFHVGRNVPPTWSVEMIALDVQADKEGRLHYILEREPVYVEDLVPLDDAILHPRNIERLNVEGLSPPIVREYAVEIREVDGPTAPVYYELIAQRHWRYWSLLPAAVAVALCFLTREPLTSLFAGIVVGAFLLGTYDITGSVLLESFMSPGAATILLLYLWLLGSLMGIWSRTGAAQAFAELMTRTVVRGPRTAKLVAWMTGVVFFQGGTVSAVLVGTTVKPVADRERVSHEELSYIVDSTASPIASLLAFNAWPAYVQAFIFVAGVPWLATQEDRIRFFFQSIPLCFYAMFAILFTLLLSVDRSPFTGRRMRAAIRRARQTGELNAPDAEPLSARELQSSNVPPGYVPTSLEFIAPLAMLIGTAIATFLWYGSPNVHWAFGFAVLLAMLLALVRGMRLRDLISGVNDGLKGVVLGSVILLLAVTIGGISKQAGGGLYLVELLGTAVPYWLLPVMLQLLTIIIAFSTGTSWGTYAVAFPLAMPLSWAVANAQGLEHPQLFMMICFAAVLNGSVYGDQCSPISDTTVLSSMSTGCDLMDHVKTQLPQATVAAVLAAIGWTTLALAAV